MNATDKSIAAMLDKKKKDFDIKWKSPPILFDEITNFTPIKALGKGAFGKVILVRENETGKLYACKQLNKAQIVKTRQVENAMNEKNIIACCNFPFLIGIGCTFQDTANLYLLLEFAAGGELFGLLRKLKRFPEGWIKFYTCQVMMGLEYLHFLTIVYRDLKPENILLCEDGYLKVADLGFAKLVPREKRTWTLCGTPDYMAPEIIQNKGYSTAVDWWAFGVLIYELVCGVPPFMQRDQMKTFERIISGKYKFNEHFRPEVKDLITNLLQIDLSKRYGNLMNGINDIRHHEFFQEIDWVSIYKKKIKPPYKPKTMNYTDAISTVSFDTENPPPTDKYAKEFRFF